MREIIIDEEFQSLMPPLDKETHMKLLESIMRYGCRDAIALWNDIIIDGHNRYAICTQFGLRWKNCTGKFKS